MNEKQIRQLRRQFILLSMFSLMVAMILMGGLMYLTNQMVMHNQIRSTLREIAANDGELPVTENTQVQEEGFQDALFGSRFEKLETEETGTEETEEENLRRFSYRIPPLREVFDAYEGHHPYHIIGSSHHYFAVLYDGNDTFEELISNTAVNQTLARRYADFFLERNKKLPYLGTFGLYYDYIIDKRSGGNGTIFVCLDSTVQIQTSYRLLYVGLIIIGFGLILTFLITRALSVRVTMPEVKNAQRQKQFITNASHELKTPLAVIRANTEVEQMLHGENEWNASTLKQIDRMTGLIANLVMIARAEEKADSGELVPIDLAKIAQETAKTFLPVAQQEGKSLDWTLPEELVVNATESDFRQLLSVLLDNAIKYCDEGGHILLTLQRKGKQIRLEVTNSYAKGAGIDYTRFFDRFYREDVSHNVDKGGYGIGLSIADSIVRKYRGNIDMNWKNGDITFAIQAKFM